MVDVKADVEIVNSTDSYSAMVRSEIDMQIATAKAYPRTLSKVKERIVEMATIDKETAISCWYRLPRDGKQIEGESVRMAEIVAASYGNLRCQARVIGIDEKFVTAQGVVHDLETNVAYSVEVRRRITTKDGRRFSDDMIVTTSNAGCSIAVRNAIFRVVPKALIASCRDAIYKTAFGDKKTFMASVMACIDKCREAGIDKAELYQWLGVRGDADFNIEHLKSAAGWITAIQDGDSSVDDLRRQFATAQDDKPKSDPLKSGKHDAKKKEEPKKAEQAKQEVPEAADVPY